MLSINCKGRLLSFEEPVVMGIINVTPDSFYSGSRSETIDDILHRAEKMISDGAAIIDIGGQSTRPGSIRINADEELQRVLPAIESISNRFPHATLSIDTFYAKVAEHAVQAGAAIVNDISAGTLDGELMPTVAKLQVPYVLMHMQGQPQSMQQNPQYKNVVLEVFDFLNFKAKELVNAGIKDVIIDPGFGFGKNAEHNFKLLANLSYFSYIGKPIVIGLSRKST
ncbi:MAG: dihydropteroate synthase, partial [Chitinophagaceae bacterium]|nr:dihydropteroate synthase [Chitinophagaceae bacterium]